MAKKVWTKQSYREFCDSVREDLRGDMGEVEDGSVFYDIAGNLIQGVSGLKTFIIKELGAVDYRGRLADDISF